MPRFSIVIPTRNRPELITSAIHSALSQTHGDFEIVISDNSSDDRTQHIAGQINDQRVRYVRTNGSLLMYESWAFAARQTRGEYICYLCDDDTMHPRLLEVVDRTIIDLDADVVAWGRCGYFAPGAQGPGSNAYIEFRTAYSDRHCRIDGDHLIDAAYDMRITHNDCIPRMLNTMAHHDVFERAATEGPGMYRPSCPDYSAMLAMALYARSIVFLDAPLSLTGMTPQSTGWHALHNAAIDPEFVDGLLARQPDMAIPDGLWTVHCWIAQTYMQCAAEHPRLAGRQLNRVHRFGAAGREILRWKSAGCDTDDLESSFRSALAALPETQRRAVDEFLGVSCSVETDAFCTPISGDEQYVLDHGPLCLPRVTLDAVSPSGMADVALHIDDWIREHGWPVDAMLAFLLEQADGRTLVIYGMGNGGRALCRCLSEELRDSGRVLFHDDGCDPPEGCRKLKRASHLDPNEHIVFVTPLEHKTIALALNERGFERGRTWFCLADRALVEGAV